MPPPGTDCGRYAWRWTYASHWLPPRRPIPMVGTCTLASPTSFMLPARSIPEVGEHSIKYYGPSLSRPLAFGDAFATCPLESSYVRVCSASYRISPLFLAAISMMSTVILRPFIISIRRRGPDNAIHNDNWWRKPRSTMLPSPSACGCIRPPSHSLSTTGECSCMQVTDECNCR
ncbi:hypothetical protein DENSPDRAFT_835472 [Dentipellis sp. KUC8613]|nr:hypothetical protein DENSPDRAFT_835472 [Dentipellis sp. KUC8613]